MAVCHRVARDRLNLSNGGSMPTVPEHQASVTQPPKKGAIPSATQPARVLVVDVDGEFHRTLSTHLTDIGFDAVACSSGQAALDCVAMGDSAEVIVMDWSLPETNSLRVVRDLRQRGVTPVILLTDAANEVKVNAKALESGSVDFIDESRRLSILAWRIQLIVEAVRGIPEHPPREMSQIMRIGSLELHFDAKRAHWAGQVIDFTLTEFRMVSQLALKPGEDVSYRELYDLVHGNGFVAGHGIDGYRANVRSFIKRIRNKFREIHPTFNQIRNYSGVGYRWVPV
jgi:two-component system, OmpR family, response regulator ChvI